MSAGRVTIGGRRFGKTAAAAAAAGMSMDAYRALQRRVAWDTKAAVDRAVDEACRRDFPSLFPGSDWVRQEFERAAPRWSLGFDVADGRCTWCAMEWDADGVATVVSVGGRAVPASCPEGGFIFEDRP